MSSQQTFIDVQKLTGDGGVLVLGAGASREYGFPLWVDLQELLSQRWGDSDFKNRWKWVDSDNNSPLDPIVSAFETQLSDPQGRTIDQIVEATRERAPGAERFFRFSIAEIMSDEEERDKLSLDHDHKTGWVEDLADSIALLASLGTLNVITLNYERSFQYRLTRRLVRDERIEPDREANTDPVFALRMFHVHGSIGTGPIRRPPGMSILEQHRTWQTTPTPERPYGHREQLLVVPSLTTVDGAIYYENQALASSTAYSNANQVLANASYAVIAGVSPLGMSESLLAKPTQVPTTATVVFTNAGSEVKDIPDRFKASHPQFLGLHTNQLTFS